MTISEKRNVILALAIGVQKDAAKAESERRRSTARLLCDALWHLDNALLTMDRIKEI
jgi:hypothetical protein